MERRRAQLVHIETHQPVDPDWAPLIAPDEITEANRLLAAKRLQWRWQWLPSTIALTGAVILQAPASHVAI